MAAAILLDLVLFVALPLALWRLVRGVVPLAVLPILIGIGLSVAGSRAGIGPPGVPTAFGDLAGWAGVLILAFSAGLEARSTSSGNGEKAPTAVDFTRHSPRRILATALAALALPFAAGSVVAYQVLLPLPGWLPSGIDRTIAAAGIGLCLAVSALPVLVGIVREMPEAERRLGRLALRIAAIDDIVLWLGLGALLLFVRAGGGIGAWGWPDAAAIAVILVLAAAGRLIDRLPARRADWLAWGVAGLYLAGGAWSTATLGLHALIGAYLAGVLTPAAVAGRIPAERIGFIALAFLAPLFFGHRGLGIDGSAFGWQALAAAGGLLAISALSKLLAVVLLPPVPDMRRADTLALGALLQCKGLMEIVAATILRDQGILSEVAYAVLVTLAILSTTATKPLFAVFTRARPATGPADGRAGAGE